VCKVPYTSTNGSSRNTTKLCEASGVIQREYVEVPDALLAKTAELKKYFEASYEYVASMKPKATEKAE
jgi:hypothetical protein